MRKSKVNKMKLASVLLLSTVLIPNIAYADEEIDESMEAETAVDPAETENSGQTAQDTVTEENTDVNEEVTNEEPVEESLEIPPSINNENDIETNAESADNAEETVDDSSGTNDGSDSPILQPAEPGEEPEETGAAEDSESDNIPAEVPEETGNTDDSNTGDYTEGEEETPEAEIPEQEDETQTEENVPSEPDSGESSENQDNNFETPELPTEPIEPLEPVEPEEPAETEPSEQPNTEVEQNSGDGDNNNVPAEEVPAESTEEPVENTAPENSGSTDTEGTQKDEANTEANHNTAGNGPKKLYHYDYGDILEGITFKEENLQNDISTLDQRVSRVMSSKIIEEKNLTEAQKLELQEQVKSEKTNTYDGEELPNTGETSHPNYALAGLLTVFGGALLIKSKKTKTDN